MQYAKKRLSQSRFQHVQGVVETIHEIADAHELSVEDCRTIAWLHDSAKEEERQLFLELVEQGRIEVDPETMEAPGLWHGFHAAYIGRERFGVTNEDLLEAVRRHPTGSPAFSQEGRALFVADYCEPGRPMRTTKEILEESKKNLAAAALRVVEEKIAYLRGKGKTPHSRSLAFRDQLQTELRN